MRVCAGTTVARIAGVLWFIAGACHCGPPPGCECIGKEKAQELIKKSDKATLAEVGADFGSYCAAWEDGACRPDTCPAGPGHTCGTKKECKALWGDQHNFDLDQVFPSPPYARTAVPR